MEQWAIDHLGQLGTAAAALSTFAAAAWKLKVGARLERFGRWSLIEVRTTIWARRELASLRNERRMREAAFLTMEATNEDLLRRGAVFVDSCSTPDFDRRTS